MSIGVSNVPDTNYVDQVVNVPKDYEGFSSTYNVSYRRLAQGINDREIAKYDCLDIGTVTPPGFERITGQIWFGTTPQIQRLAYRKLVQFPALIVGTNSQPHNLGTITGYFFTRIDCVLESPTTPSFAPLSNTGATNSINVDGTNVNITLPGGSPWVGYTAIVILEYVKS